MLICYSLSVHVVSTSIDEGKQGGHVAALIEYIEYIFLFTL